MNAISIRFLDGLSKGLDATLLCGKIEALF